MARRYAPLYTSIWQDETFKSLASTAQWLYLVAVSQPNMQWCGVVPFTARRWASYARDATAKQVAKDAVGLIAVGLVVLDGDTEEMWVRSFIKHNVLDQPKLLAAARREAGEVHSQAIRKAIATEYGWATDTPSDGHPDGLADTIARGTSRNGESCVLDVGVKGQGSEREKHFTENTNTNTELADWLRHEAERQADAWLARNPANIVDRSGWIAKRIQSLALEHHEIPESRAAALACLNPNCREGYDLAGAEPVRCDTCKAARR